MSEPVAVHIACPCPGTPHPDGDDVYLRPKLGLAGGVALQSLFTGYLREASEGKHSVDMQELTGMLVEGYLLNGIVGWTLVDDKGVPLPLDKDAVREQLLSDFVLSEKIGDVADDLYYTPVLAPLLSRLSDSLQTSPTNGSTSATKSSKARTARRRSRSTSPSSKPPTPLKPSSTSTTQTASTGATLVALAGGSTG